MAPTTGTVPPRRKPPVFKPPRPISSGAVGQATASKSIAPPRKSALGKVSGKSAPAKALGARGGFKPATTTVISSDSEPDEEAEEDEEDEAQKEQPDASDDEMNDVSTTSAVPISSQDESKPAIPPKLLARLLYEGFEDKDMRIGKEPMNVLGKYMETFVREAIARAGFERQETEGAGGVSDGFLQVEDLEKLAPQLLLDF